MTRPSNIAILITGGTLDKVHDTFTEGLVFGEGNKSRISHILRNGRCDYPRLEVLMKIDSLEMTDTHRSVLLNAALAAPEDKIIITHGTGTMEITAQYLQTRIKGKTIILTGAMRPQSLGRSDAGFNLGGALIAAQTLPHGVYGVMNGCIFEANDLQKNTEEGRFDR